jgi:hypothetical protein
VSTPTNAAPEPATLGLIGAALLFVSLALKRRP